MKMSPLTLGLLALLAYRTYQGKGRLADMLGTGQPEPGAPDRIDEKAGRGAQPETQTGGGLGDILGNILGGGSARTRAAAPGIPGAQQDGLGGLLGGLLGGGAAGGILSGGLGSLLEQFQQGGQGDTAQSWINKGENRPISAGELERAVGKDTLDELARRSGRSYDDVVAELSSELPGQVDQLTPEGRVPTESESSRWV